MCARPGQAAAATAHRKMGSDATEKTGNPTLTAALYVPARYRGRTRSFSTLATQTKDINAVISCSLAKKIYKDYKVYNGDE